ncbi:Os09g0306632 [Oryza sativa Japonica Group]|uniref:Small polypeptide ROTUNDIFOLIA LIKE 2 n=1 Tax=Oryza sativa subsp. japonica TaxID=39947 RepID=RTFL2_ORYSJ|nr:RecName: Full=Small polypeptide ROTUNDIFOLIA LIKE 2; Short=OsRTFL2; Short=Small polypeptide ROT-FOUR-LIKE 2 [Oryza sativa Japonica Group]KAF2915562.1 hypothetical protein DAI22_09g044500 [Oryza sativa Japonica Group]BAT07358.1 Os09g0306632 [Oryza sativa Japonica Group]
MAYPLLCHYIKAPHSSFPLIPHTSHYILQLVYLHLFHPLPCTQHSHQTMKIEGRRGQMGRLNRAFREKRARFYIFRRCVIMLLRWSD